MFSLLKLFKKKDWLVVGLIVGLVLMQVWLDLTLPDYTSALVQKVSQGPEVVTMDDVWSNGLMMLLCAFGSMMCSFVCGFFCTRLGSRFSRSLRSTLFDKVTSFSSREMREFSTPSLITRTTNDVVQIQMFISIGLQIMIKAPVTAIWAITKISATGIEWTMATLLVVLSIVLVVGIVVLLVLPKFKKSQKLIDNLNDATRENVSGVRVIRAFNAENYQEQKFEKANKELMDNRLFTSKAMGLLMPYVTLCMNVLSIAIYWIGAYLINDAALMDKVVLMGNMTAFMQIAIHIVMSFIMMIVVFIVLPRALVSAKRIKEVLSASPSIVEGYFDGETDSKGEIEFRGVSFRYPDGQNDVINDINFSVNRGEIVAIVGSTGSGKTSLIDLIPRFRDVTQGEVLVDGINVKDYKSDALQKKVAVVSQKAVLFKGDIKSNVIYGHQGRVLDDDQKVLRALEIAKADFVGELEKGIHAPVAQGGTNFSGGQKQRLSIARAIYKDAEIIIFDDSFSALDYKTDMLVRKGIKENLQDKTIVIVAQRIGTIRDADKILVLDGGKIVGMGKHQELLDSCPLYKEIALSQLSKEEL